MGILGDQFDEVLAGWQHVFGTLYCMGLLFSIYEDATFGVEFIGCLTIDIYFHNSLNNLCNRQAVDGERCTCPSGWLMKQVDDRGSHWVRPDRDTYVAMSDEQ